MTTPFDLAGVRATFRAVARAAVPASAALDTDGWARADAIVADALGARPPAVQRQVRLFLRVLDVLALLRFGRRLAALDVERARRMLDVLGRAPLLPVRRGVWGVRTLALMGVYAQPAARERIGYRADARGWAARGGGVPWPERGGRGGAEDGVLTVAGPHGSPS